MRRVPCVVQRYGSGTLNNVSCNTVALVTTLGSSTHRYTSPVATLKPDRLYGDSYRMYQRNRFGDSDVSQDSDSKEFGRTQQFGGKRGGYGGGYSRGGGGGGGGGTGGGRGYNNNPTGGQNGYRGAGRGGFRDGPQASRNDTGQVANGAPNSGNSKQVTEGNVSEINPFLSDGKLLSEIMKCFPLNENKRVDPITVPNLMAALPEQAQEVIGERGGLLQFLQERRQLFVVRKAKTSSGNEAWFVAATNVAATMAQQKAKQLGELKEGVSGIKQENRGFDNRDNRGGGRGGGYGGNRDNRGGGRGGGYGGNRDNRGGRGGGHGGNEYSSNRGGQTGGGRFSNF